MTTFNRAERLRQRRLLSLAAGNTVFLLVAAACALWFGCFYGLSAAGLFDLDEGLYATVARQMVESGDWLVPRVGSVAFFDKPPLTYWPQAVSLHLFGATALAVRLPSATAAALTAAALWWWARRRGMERLGWLAALLYLFCPLTFGLARQAVMDSLLTLWLTAAVIGWIEGYQGDRRGYLVMAAGAGLATMTKGLIGLLLPSAAFAVWLLARKNARELLRVPWAAGGMVYLGLVLPWHLAVWHLCGPVFVREYIVHHHIQRFLGRDFGHKSPFWTYLAVMLAGLFPWSVFGLKEWWRSLRAARSPRRSLDSAEAIWAIWAAVVVGFFSLSQSKLPGYIQPAVPALALLAAARLDRLWQVRRGLTAGEGLVLASTGLILGALFLAIGGLASSWRSHPVAVLGGKAIPASLSVPLTHLVPVAVALGALFWLGSAAILAVWASTPRVAGTAVGVSLASLVVTAQFGLPIWSASEIQPLHDLARQTLPALQRGEPVVIYMFVHRRPSLRFVLGHTAEVHETCNPAVLQQYVGAAGRGAILTGRETSLPPLTSTIRREAIAGRWALWRWEPRTTESRRVRERTN
jgi:4-amino-4-deoxy-L-arabinose transferase-like glycosyltransferase